MKRNHCLLRCCCVALLFVGVTLKLHSQAANPNPLRDSLAVLNRQIAANPQSTDLRLRKAAINIELDQWEYAVEEYGRVLDIDRRNLTALFFRAYANNHLHRYHPALADYEQFLAIVPRHFEARMGLAMVKRNMGRKIEAADELNRLVEMYPDSSLSYAIRADFETEQGQIDLALYDWEQALRLDPTNKEYQAARQQLVGRRKKK